MTTKTNEIKFKMKDSIPHYFWPVTKEIVFNPTKAGYAFRSGRGVGKSIKDAREVFDKLWNYPGTSCLVNVPEFSTLQEKFLKNLKDALKIFKIPKSLYCLKETRNYIEFNTVNPLGDSYIQFCYVNKSDLSAQGSEPKKTDHLWCHRLDYEIGTWVNWTLRDYINFNSTFSRSCQYYKVIDGKHTKIKCDKDDKCEKWTPFCTVAEYNMPSRDKKQYSFMKELDNYFKKNDEWYHSQLDYTMLRDDEQIRFLGKAQMREIANTKKYAPLEYREVYLGEEVSGGDSIYVNFDRHRALVQPNHSLYSDINWKNAKVNIGVDIGIHDATVCTCKIRWYDDDHMQHVRTIAQWYHSNGTSRYEKWDNDHRTKEKALLPPTHKTPVQYCLFIEQFYEYCWTQVGGRLQSHPKINFQMDTSTAVSGGTWYEMLFIAGIDGRSILHADRRGGCPQYLNASPVWSKFGKVVEERIPIFVHLFTLPNCYTTVSEIECEAFENARWTYDNKRDENPRDKSLLIDVLNSSEYAFEMDDYYDIEDFYHNWVSRLALLE